jgi:hypothetical protein
MSTEKQVVTINQEELLLLLMSVEKPTFTNILSLTKPKMNKGGNPYYDRLTKTSKGNYFIGGTYQDMVNIRMMKEGIEGEFESMECSVGVKVEGSKCLQFNENHNRFYLQYFIFDTSNIKSKYEVEGVEVDKELVKPYLTKKSTTSRQPQENKHKPQSFMLSSIKEISLGGKLYKVE